MRKMKNLTHKRNYMKVKEVRITYRETKGGLVKLLEVRLEKYVLNCLCKRKAR